MGKERAKPLKLNRKLSGFTNFAIDDWMHMESTAERVCHQMGWGGSNVRRNGWIRFVPDSYPILKACALTWSRVPGQNMPSKLSIWFL